MSENRYNLIVEPDEEDLRLDQFLVLMVASQSRSYLQKLIKQGSVLVNNRKVKPSYNVRLDDVIDVIIPEPVPLEVRPEAIPLEILFEDENILVLNKSAGITVHPSLNNLSGTLVNALLFYCGDKLSGIGGVLRPGILHRLDKDTSGCLVVAKNDISHREIARQFHERKIFKEYLAIVSGWMKHAKGRLEFSIGRHPAHRKKMAVRFDSGKDAVTEYQVMERFNDATYLLIKLGTGRTHQIRVHMSYIGHPILGDKEYSKRKAQIDGIQIPRQMLHAARLGLTHPVTKEWMEFCAPVPKDIEELLEKLKSVQNHDLNMSGK